MMRQFQANSYLFGGNAPYVEELYERYLDNPGSVPDKWRAYFDKMQLVPAADGSASTPDVAHAPIVESFALRAKENKLRPAVAPTDLSVARKQVDVQSIIAAYRFLGSRWADLDPLKRQERPAIPELEPAFYDLTEADMDTEFSAANTYFGQEQMTLREIIKALRQTYCGTIGAEFMYIGDPAQKRWMQQRLESIRSTPNFSAQEKKAHPRAPDGGRRPRALPAHQVRRPEAFLARRRRELHRLDGRDHPACRRQRRRRRSSSAWPTAAVSTCWSTRSARCRRTCSPNSKASTAIRPAGRRRQVPPGILERRHDAGRPGAPVAGLQPVAPRDRQSGRRRLGARRARSGAATRRRPGAADPGARRRCLRRPGRRHGDAEPRADARLRHRRHGAHRDQQPDRLHDLGPPRYALDLVLHGRGQDDRGAGATRERRRSRSGGARHADRAWITAASSPRTSWWTSSASASSVTTSRTRRRSRSR